MNHLCKFETTEVDGGFSHKCPACGHAEVAPSSRLVRMCQPPSRQHADRCTHRGEEIRQQECQTCSGHQRIKVFACPLRGECTIGKKLAGIVCCAVVSDCGDFSATAD